MSLTDAKHTRIVSGLEVESAAVNRMNEIVDVSGGTLTGVATRVVNNKVQKMLVTCQHTKTSPHVGFDLGLTSRERVYYYAL